MNFIVQSRKLTPTELKSFFARLSTFRNSFENVLEYQNGSKFAKGPNLTYFLILIKKNFGLWKSREFLIFTENFSGPLNTFLNR